MTQGAQQDPKPSQDPAPGWRAGAFIALPDAALVLDRDGRILDLNPTAEGLFGWARDALVGRHIVELLPDEALADFGVEESLAHPTDRAGLHTARLERRGGDTFMGRIAVGRGGPEEAPFYVVSIRDVSRLVEQEQEREQQRHMDAVGRMAGGLAHDLNNLLMVMQGNCELASLKLERDPEKARALLGEVAKGGEQTARHVRTLTGVARRRMLQPERIDLVRRVDEHVARVQTTTTGDVEIEVEHAVADIPVCADADALDQALEAMLDHARDAVGGAGHVHVATRIVEVGEDDMVLDPGRYVAVDVYDDGEKLSDDALAALFVPYAPAVGRKHHGLDLACAHGFAVQTGGTLRSTPIDGRGTRLRLLLPADLGPCQCRGQVERPAAATPMTTHRTILVVDDEEAVRRYVTTCLQGAGYIVLAAGTADEAMGAIGMLEGALDLLLTDVVMPGTDGRELALQVRSIHPETPVVFMSGYDQGLVTDGPDPEPHFLAKPFTPEVLLRKVRVVLEHARTQPADEATPPPTA